MDPTITPFDTDSISVCPDNCTTQHICNDASLMEDLMDIPFEIPMSSVGGMAIPKKIGTMVLKIKDDDGVVHTERFPDTYFIPQSPKILISPVQWSEQINDEDEEGKNIQSFRTYSRLRWRSKFTKTFDHPPHSRLPDMLVNEGYSKFSNFARRVSLFVRSKDDGSTHSFRVAPREGTRKEYELDLQTDGDENSPLINTNDHWEATFSPKDFTKMLQNNDCKIVHVQKVHPPCAYNNHIPHYDVNLVGSDQTYENISEDHLHPFDSVDPASIENAEDIIYMDEINKCFDENDLPSDEYKNSDHMDALQQELMDWHYKLNHTSFSTLIEYANLGLIPRRLRNVTQLPLCDSCLYGKQHWRPWRTSGKHKSSIRKDSENEPGSNTSVDHMISAHPGLIPQVTGKLTLARFWVECVFVDHFTSFIYIHLCRGISGLETIEAKEAYERLAQTYGVTVQGYQADNGRFADKLFKDCCSKLNQVLTFCGVGAHHQNGIIKRAIKETTQLSYTLLLHAQRLWPEAIDTMLWTFDLKAAAERLNKVDLAKDGTTRKQRFSRSKDNAINTKDFHPFGCPVYVLDSKLQSVPATLPKWEPRCQVGVYLGHSPAHTGNVALVLNLTTGHVSPQYHVVFDDNFSTVPSMRKGTVPTNWKKLFDNHCESAIPEDFEKAKRWSMDFNNDNPTSTSDATADSSPSISEEVQDNLTTPRQSNTSQNKGDSLSDVLANKEDGLEQNINSNKGASADEPSSTSMPSIQNLSTNGLQRSSHLKRNNFRWDICSQLIFGRNIFSFNLFPTSISSDNPPVSLLQRPVNSMEHFNLLMDDTINYISPYSLLSITDNETYTYGEMLKQNDRKEFIEEMLVEVTDHFLWDHFEKVPRSRIGKNKTIKLILSFKQKRYTNSDLMKHKARLCAHGGMTQWGINYWET